MEGSSNGDIHTLSGVKDYIYSLKSLVREGVFLLMLWLFTVSFNAESVLIQYHWRRVIRMGNLCVAIDSWFSLFYKEYGMSFVWNHSSPTPKSAKPRCWTARGWLLRVPARVHHRLRRRRYRVGPTNLSRQFKVRVDIYIYSSFKVYRVSSKYCILKILRPLPRQHLDCHWLYK